MAHVAVFRCQKSAAGASEPRPSIVDFELLLRRALGVLEIRWDV